MSFEQQLNDLTRIFNRNKKAYDFYSRKEEEAKQYMLGYPFYRKMKYEKEKAEKRIHSAVNRYNELCLSMRLAEEEELNL